MQYMALYSTIVILCRWYDCCIGSTIDEFACKLLWDNWQELIILMGITKYMIHIYTYNILVITCLNLSRMHLYIMYIKYEDNDN